MKWKSFTLRVLLLVMVGKRIKEPGIFTAVAPRVTRVSLDLGGNYREADGKAYIFTVTLISVYFR